MEIHVGCVCYVICYGKNVSFLIAPDLIHPFITSRRHIEVPLTLEIVYNPGFKSSLD